MEEGILDIRVSKATLVKLGYTSSDATEEAIAAVQTEASRNVKALLTKYGDASQVIYAKDGPINEAGSNSSRYANSAIVINFDEKVLGPRKFERLIIQCGQEALKAILKYKK